MLGGAVSGGLDSCTVAHWLSDNGFTVHSFTVDLGQPDEESLDAVADRMLACGASAATIVPGREALAEGGLKVIQAQAKYEGDYWNTTGIARPITVQAILPRLRAAGVDTLFHGCTGRGNDQVRFQLACNTLDPSIKVYAPWRDRDFIERFPGRAQMIDYCEANGLPIRPSSQARYSTDANFLGLTHEAGDLESVTIDPFFVEPGMGVWPWDAPDTPQTVTVRWEAGTPAAIDGERVGLVDAFRDGQPPGGGARRRHRAARGGEPVRGREVARAVRGAGHGVAGPQLRVPAPVRAGPAGRANCSSTSRRS